LVWGKVKKFFLVNNSAAGVGAAIQTGDGEGEGKGISERIGNGLTAALNR